MTELLRSLTWKLAMNRKPRRQRRSLLEPSLTSKSQLSSSSTTLAWQLELKDLPVVLPSRNRRTPRWASRKNSTLIKLQQLCSCSRISSALYSVWAAYWRMWCGTQTIYCGLICPTIISNVLKTKLLTISLVWGLSTCMGATFRMLKRSKNWTRSPICIHLRSTETPSNRLRVTACMC